MKISLQNRSGIAKALRSVPILQNFSPDNLRQLVMEIDTRHVPKGEEVVLQTDESTDLYIILKGAVRVILSNSNGKECFLRRLGKGDFFGEMSFVDGKPRSASIFAEKKSDLAVLSRPMIYQALQKEPAFAFKLIESLVERLRTSMSSS